MMDYIIYLFLRFLVSEFLYCAFMNSEAAVFSGFAKNCSKTDCIMTRKRGFVHIAYTFEVREKQIIADFVTCCFSGGLFLVFQLKSKICHCFYQFVTLKSSRKTSILKSTQITCFVASFELSFIMWPLNAAKSSSIG